MGEPERLQQHAENPLLSAEEARQKRVQLVEDGYCVVPGVLQGDFLEELRAWSDELLDRTPVPHKYRYQGSDIHVATRRRQRSSGGSGLMRALLPALSLLLVAGCSTVTTEKAPTCDGKQRRPANPHGSVLEPSERPAALSQNSPLAQRSCRA